jgi:hypothetical protein
MKTPPLLPALCLAASLSTTLSAASPSLTIYNQSFAVVRDTVPLDLKKGINEVSFDGATLRLEPDSVILRDSSGAPLQILEQNYRNDPVTQRLLLSLFEGKEIDFAVHEQQKPDHVVKGKVIRSGYVPQGGASGGAGMEEPIIETEGKIRFQLPGEPLFPSLGDDTILKPRLAWKIQVPKEVQTSAELGYVTGGFSWEASYNLVAPEKGEKLDLIGWVTMDNQSGREFREAKVNLMAGDVNKIAPPARYERNAMRSMSMVSDAASAVTEKTFDEYHLYTLERPVTLRDHEKVQVEFLHASGVASEVIYTYDGAAGLLPGSSGGPLLEGGINPEGNRKITVTREFKNTKENGLGIPLPKGKMRLYRTNGTQLEFTGENTIDHTPKDETVRIETGEAFDLVGERKRTDFKVDMANHWLEETFEITLRNHKKDSVSVRVVEHLFRWVNWQITQNSDPFVKKDAQTIEFRVPLKPDEEKKLTYKVRYTW